MKIGRRIAVRSLPFHFLLLLRNIARAKKQNGAPIANHICCPNGDVRIAATPELEIPTCAYTGFPCAFPDTGPPSPVIFTPEQPSPTGALVHEMAAVPV